MQTEKKYVMDQKPMTKYLIAGGAIGPLLFTIIFLIEGATRPGYNAWHHYVSSLSLSNQGWMQIANFLVCGLLMLGFAIGLRQVLYAGRRSMWGAVMIGICGVALIFAGLFVTDPVLGYPMSSHSSGPQTFHGTIHGIAGLIAFSSLAIAGFVMARRFTSDPDWKGWALYSTVTGILVAVFFIASTAVSVLDEKGILPESPTGLFQRIAIIAGWSWIAFLAIQLLSKMRSPILTTES